MRRDSYRKTQHACIAAKFMLHVLTEDQKADRVNINQELLGRVSVDENFLKKIVTGKETWVYGYDVETKAQSSQWVGQGSPPTEESSNESIQIEGGDGGFL